MNNLSLEGRFPTSQTNTKYVPAPTAQVPPMFQRKTVIHVQLKQRRNVGRYPQTRVLPIGPRGTADIA